MEVSVNDLYKDTLGQQAFFISVTAKGGANKLVFANLTIVPDCSFEIIYLNPEMPDYFEDPLKLFVEINKLPVLKVN